MIEDAERRTELVLHARERVFTVRFRAGRVCQALGYAPDLATVASATRAWHSGARLPELASNWPFLGSVKLAETRERGDAFEYNWRLYYENHLRQAHLTWPPGGDPGHP